MRDILRDIVADDQRAGEVIRRLRLLLKKGEVHHLPLDLNEVVQDVLRLVRNDLLNHNITLHTEFAPDLPVIKGDRVQLQQVLLNLIVNATDAMADSRARGQAADRAHGTHSGDGGVRVSVVDRGTGLAAGGAGEDLRALFHHEASGMGLGLKVCRTIIDRPWRAASTGEQRRPRGDVPLHAAGGRKEQPDEPGTRPTVFIVDDDPSVLKAFRGCCGRPG